MATKNTALRNAMANAFGALFNSGSLTIYNSADAILVTFMLGATAFNAAAVGTIEAHADTLGPENAVATGTASYAVLLSSDTTIELGDLTVGTTSSFDVVISSTSISSGQPIDLIQLDWTESAIIAA